MPNTKNLLTGRFFFRDKGDVPGNDDRKMMMVCGVIAFPKDYPIKGEHIYPVVGMQNDFSDKLPQIEITIGIKDNQDISSKTVGNSTAKIFKSPIWKV